jgi:ABC-type branched-subunit amino acid transport system permease subunit
MAGLAGALFAVQKTVVTPDDFTADFSIFFLLMVVLGGAGRPWGPVVGAVCSSWCRNCSLRCRAGAC